MTHFRVCLLSMVDPQKKVRTASREIYDFLCLLGSSQPTDAFEKRIDEIFKHGGILMTIQKILVVSLLMVCLFSGFVPSIVGAAEDGGIFDQRDFSNVMFFGDSLTDLGNFPESLTLEGDTSGDGLFTNLYVPIANPLNPLRDRILPGLSLLFPPTNGGNFFLTQTLPNQLELCSTQEGCVHRRFRSVNWTQYFMYNAILRSLVAFRADYRPWVEQFTTPLRDVSIRQSVNYAFGGALSGSGCANWNQTPFATCTLPGETLQDSVFNTQNVYRTTQSETDGVANRDLRDTIIIPGLRKQIEIFEADKAAGRVKVNDQTLYVIYTGANDLSVAFLSFVNGNTTFEEFLVALNVTIPSEIAGKANPLSGVNALLDLGAKNILVIGQFNLGITPTLLDMADVEGVLARHAVAAAFAELLAMFNNSLQNRIQEFDNNGIGYVDIQTPIREAADSFFIGFRRGYFRTIGERCIDDTQGRIERGGAASCFTRRDVSIPVGFWNDSHLGSQYYQLIANAVLSRFSSSPSLPPRYVGLPDKFFSDLSDEELKEQFELWYR